MTISQTLNSLFSLEGKRGILSGGSSGLGLATSRLLADAGAQVFTFSRSGQAKVALETPLPETVEQLKVDICDYSSVQSTVDDIGSAGGIDFLINNAATLKKHPANTFDMTAFQKIQAVNVEALFHLCKTCFPYLKKAPEAGRVVSISSISAHLGFSGIAPYCSSKSAITGLTRSLAVEWAEHDILANSISPGWIQPKNNKPEDEEYQQKVLTRTPLRRYARQGEIAPLVLFLLSSASTYITGQDFIVDGGVSALGF